MPWIDPKSRYTGDTPRYSDDATPVVNIRRVEGLFARPMNTSAQQAIVHVLREDSILEEITVICEDPTTGAAYSTEPTIQVRAVKYNDEGIDISDQNQSVPLHTAIVVAGEGGLTANVPTDVAVDEDVAVLSAGTPLIVQSEGVLGSNGSDRAVADLGDGTADVPVWYNPLGGGHDDAWFVTAIQIISGGTGTVVAGDWTAGTIDLVKAYYGATPTSGVNSILTAPVDLDDDESAFVIDTEDLANRIIGDQVLWAVYDSATIDTGTPLVIQITLEGTTGPKNIHLQLRFKERSEGRGA